MDILQSFCDHLFDVLKQKTKFPDKTEKIKDYINHLKREDFLNLLKEIGSIPENITVSSSGEKLYSKASDIILSRCFKELGLSSTAITERKDSADIQALSVCGYKLVADSKTFRLSRTAKNQKDFKIANLNKWRGKDYDYAILVAPYFQYPKTNSQIYSSALDQEVCLLSWEHIAFMLEKNIMENSSFSLENIWSSSTRIMRESNINRQNYLFPYINKILCDRIGVSQNEFDEYLSECKNTIITRSVGELRHIKNEILEMEKLTKNEAIKELIKSKKLNERIKTIKKYIASLETMEE